MKEQKIQGSIRNLIELMFIVNSYGHDEGKKYEDSLYAQPDLNIIVEEHC